MEIKKIKTKDDKNVSGEQSRMINRKDRRHYLKRIGILDKKKNMNLSDWIKEVKSNIKEGKNLHREHEDEWSRATHEYLSEKESKIIGMLTEQNYTKEMIDKYLTNWYKLV